MNRYSVSLTEEPAELDAVEPVERVILSTSSGHRELAFLPEGNNGHYWHVVELVRSEVGGVPSQKIVRFLDLEKHAVIPLFTLQSDNAEACSVVVAYDKFRREYPLLNQHEADKLLRLVTGYKVCERYGGVSCSVILKRRLHRDDEDGGTGEMQLWEWPRSLEMGNPQSQALLASSMSGAGSIASTVQAIAGTRGTSLQTTGGRELLLSSLSPPPVLAVFMHDGSRYKMMKADVTDLKFSLDNSRVDLSSSTGPFNLSRLSAKTLEHWNLCTMRPTTKSTNATAEELKCTWMSLQFQSADTAGRFVDDLLRLQLSSKELERERAAVQAPLYNGLLPPSLREPKSPISSVQATSPTSSETVTPESSSFVSLPRIRSVGPLDPPSTWRVANYETETQQPGILHRKPVTHPGIAELGEREPQELYGTEVPLQRDARFGNRRHLNAKATGRWRWG